MRRFNFFRPLLLILVAITVNNITKLICISLGTTQETAESIAIIAMVAAGLFTYTRLTRNQRKR